MVCARGRPGASGHLLAKCGCQTTSEATYNVPGHPHSLPSAGHTIMNCTLALLTRLPKKLKY